MPDNTTDPDDGRSGDRSDTSPEDIYETMDPLEPYTTGELADILGIPRRVVRRLLDALNQEDKIRKKEPEPDRIIWIREAPVHECPECGHEFEIKFLHPVLAPVGFCPRCGTRLS